MRNKTSILEPIIQQIYNATTFDQAKDIIINTIKRSKISIESKQKMLSNIQDIEERYITEKSRLDAIKIYATNSMFDKKGMSTRTKYRYQ